MSWKTEIKKASEVEIVNNVVMYFNNTSPAALVDMLFGEVYGGYDQQWIRYYEEGFHRFWVSMDEDNKQKFVDAALEKYG